MYHSACFLHYPFCNLSLPNQILWLYLVSSHWCHVICRLRFLEWNLSFQKRAIRRPMFWLKLVIKFILVICFWRWGCCFPLICLYVLCNWTMEMIWGLLFCNCITLMIVVYMRLTWKFIGFDNWWVSVGINLLASGCF